MQDHRKDALSHVVADVLERFAFSFAEEDDGAVAVEDEWLRADLAFRGPEHGTVILAMPRALALSLGDNILGTDGAASGPEVGEDAARELCNITCGELLPLLFGSEAVFDLGVPVLRVQAAQDGGALPPGATVVRLSAEGHRVVAALEIRKD